MDNILNIHNDLLGRPIQIGDTVAYATPRQGYGLRLVRITDYRNKQILGIDIDTREKRRFKPTFCIVISQQIQHNLGDEITDDVGPKPLPSLNLPKTSSSNARHFFERMGIDIEQELQEYTNEPTS